MPLNHCPSRARSPELRQRTRRFVSVVCALAVCGLCVLPLAAQPKTASAPKGKIRQYYVAADEIEWDYAPSGLDQMMGMPFMGAAQSVMEHGPHRLGHVYKKAIYREYTDATSPRSSRARRSGSTRASSVRSCGRRSVTRSRAELCFGAVFSEPKNVVGD